MKILVKARPGSKTIYVKKIGGDDLFKKSTEDHFVVAVKEKAVQNKANHAIEKALAEYFKISALCVRIVSGQTSRQKIVEISE